MWELTVQNDFINTFCEIRMCTTCVCDSVVGIGMDALPDDAAVYFMSHGQIVASLLDYQPFTLLAT